MATEYYGTATGFLAYCAERNITPPTTVEAAIVGALIVTSEWIDAIYRTSFPGEKVGARDQQREWPREAAQDWYGYPIPSDAIPNELIYATYEGVREQIAKPGILSQNYVPPKYIQASVSGAISVTYAKYTDLYEMQIKFAKVSEFIAPILDPQSASRLTGGAFRM